MEEPRAKALITLLETGRLHSYKKGQMIQSTDLDQHLCLVKTGYVKRFMIANDGSIGVQTIYGPGYFFPFTLVFELLFDYKVYDGPETYYYEAMCDTQVYTLGNDLFLKAVEENPVLFKDLMFVMGRRFKSNIQRIENISMGDSYHRLAHQLIYLARNFGKDKSGAVRISIPLTQQDIADILGTTRETVSVAISGLRKKGLIKTNRYIIIPDLKKLEREAYGNL